jgi:Fur family peroxide stress response transcriptional regulator
MSGSLEALLASFERACRQAGLRLTHQRLEIYRVLVSSTHHPSAEALHRRLRRRNPRISLDTVYRTLAALAAHGLISRVETVESQGRFEAPTTRHHHLICRECKEIVDFQWKGVDEATLPARIRAWGRVDHRTVVVHGVCRTCLARGGSARRTRRPPATPTPPRAARSRPRDHRRRS